MNTASEESFLRAVLAAPDDDLPRMIYADWLDERGDPRGEFIRVQCELARIDRDDPDRPGLVEREAVLLQNHGRLWVSRLPQPPGWYWDNYFHPRSFVELPHFRRGFAAAVRLDDPDQFARSAAVVLAASPVEFVRITGTVRQSQLERMLADPRWRGIKSLTFEGAEFDAGAALILADAEHLCGLAQLDLPESDVGDSGAEAILTSPVLRRLTGLDLSYNSLVGVSLSVADGGRFERIDLSGNRLLRGWASSVLYWPRLTSLHLDETGVTAEELSELPRNSRLGRLSLRRNGLGEELAPVLANGHGFARLHDLDLGYNRLGIAVAQALVEAPWFEKLERLNLESNYLGPAALEILAAERAWSRLERLELAYCGLRDAGAVAIARSDGFPNLHYLDLEENGIGEEGCSALADSHLLDQLDVLVLHHNPLGPGVERLKNRAGGRCRICI